MISILEKKVSTLSHLNDLGILLILKWRSNNQGHSVNLKTLIAKTAQLMNQVSAIDQDAPPYPTYNFLNEISICVASLNKQINTKSPDKLDTLYEAISNLFLRLARDLVH